MKTRIAAILGLFLAFCDVSRSIGATRSYSYVRTISLSNLPGGHVTVIVPRQSGGFIFADDLSHCVYQMNNPLTSNAVPGSGDLITLYDGTTPPHAFTQPFSFQSIEPDANGGIYFSGDGGAAGPQVLHKPFIGSQAFLSMPAGRYGGGYGALGGDLVLPGVQDASLNVFKVNGSTANFSGTIAGPSSFQAVKTMLLGSTCCGWRWYVSTKADNLARSMHVYEATGATTDTINYVSANNPLVAPVPTSYTADEKPLAFQSFSISALDVSTADYILGMARNQGTVGGGSTAYDLFDLKNGPTTNKTPYASITGAETPEGPFTQQQVIYGSCFFHVDQDRYLAICVERAAYPATGQAKLYIYAEQSPSGIEGYEDY